MSHLEAATDLDSLNMDEDIEKVPVKQAVDSDVPETDHEYISGMKLWLVIISLTLACFLMMLDMSIIVTAIPRITSDFHSLNDVGWYGSAYLLPNSAIQPLTGKIYSRFSSKYTLLSFLGIFELGSLLCGVARSSVMLITGRAVAGIGAAGLVNGALTILAAAVPIYKRPAMMGIVIPFAQIGIVAGPLIGGALTQYASWRWCFYINLPIGAVCAVLLLAIKIPEHLRKVESKKTTILSVLSKLDPVGFLLFAPFAVMLLLALEWGGINYVWQSATIIGLFCGSGGMLLVFSVWEYRIGDDAMIPYSMVRKKVVWSACLTTALFFANVLIASYYLPIYFQAVKGISPALSGVYVLPSILSQMLMAGVSGALVGKMGYYLPWSIVSSVAMAVGSGLISTFTPSTPAAKWVGYQLILGLGRGCGMMIPVVAIQNVLSPEQIPVGMSLVTFCQTFGGTLFLTFAQTIFNHSLAEGLEKYAPTVNPQEVINAGASAIRQVVKPGEVEGVLKAYNLGFDRNFHLSAGAAVGTFIFCWGMGWHSIKKKKVVAPAA